MFAKKAWKVISLFMVIVLFVAGCAQPTAAPAPTAAHPTTIRRNIPLAKMATGAARRQAKQGITGHS